MLIPRSVPRRIGEVTDRDTTHMPALRPDSRFAERATAVVGMLALAVLAVGVLFLIGAPTA